ncbi:MAG: hypothetical protein R3F20_02260 [Planctomycetota bacterium]
MSRFLFVLVSLAAVVSAQSYPAWMEDARHQGPFVPTEAIPGRGPEFGLWFSRDRRMIPADPVTIFYSTTSGELAVADRRSGTLVRRSWSSGLDRVYSMELLTSQGEFPVRFLLCGRSDVRKGCVVRRLTVSAAGEPAFESVGPASAPEELWTAASAIGSSVYLIDANGLVGRRMIDTDGDGAPDAMDEDLRVAVARAAEWRLRGFLRTSDGEILIRGGRRPSWRVIEDARGSRIEELPASPPIPRLGLSSGLVVGQSRVLVSGPPAMKVTVRRADADASPGPLSGTSEIPSSGACVVELSRGLRAGEAIRATALGDPRIGDSTVARVSAGRAVALFPQLSEGPVSPGQTLELRGWGFTSDVAIRWRIGRRTSKLPVRILDDGRLTTLAPDLGPARPGWPVDGVSVVQLEVVAADGEEVRSDAIALKVRRD